MSGSWSRLHASDRHKVVPQGTGHLKGPGHAGIRRRPIPVRKVKASKEEQVGRINDHRLVPLSTAQYLIDVLIFTCEMLFSDS